ncbi:MAG TPA: hypothetical protein VER32_01595 [Pyrinomonadaceae bacterium]|nr:hypothetical protein [Pyrinomonadaceae bacterium]
MPRVRLLFLLALTLALAVSAPLIVSPSRADGGPQHRVSTDFYGVSGGNVNDRSRRYCCSGTLGALVRGANGANYILSNNHVLARSNQAAVGEDVSQPGMIDVNCQVAELVADLAPYPDLNTSNVDAAVATLRGAAMRTDGQILDIGIPSSTIRNASVGLAVTKSGRTTGHTTGTVGSVDTDVSVQYTRECGGGKRFVIAYQNQVVINSSTFSAGGDSGSLIVTNDSCRQPVALLFAGSSTTTIGNPIGEVMQRVSASAGTQMSFTGSACGVSSAQNFSVAAENSMMPQLSSLSVEKARNAKKAHKDVLMVLPSVIGVGIGSSETNASEAVLVVYIDKGNSVRPSIPKTLDGVKVRQVLTDAFTAR